MTVDEVLARWPETGAVFLSLGIPRAGGRSLRETAREEHVGIERILHALNCAIGRPDWAAVMSRLPEGPISEEALLRAEMVIRLERFRDGR